MTGTKTSPKRPADYQRLMLNNHSFKGQEILSYCRNKKEAHLNALGDFMAEWLSDKDTITLQTSGSTGQPKTIFVAKEKMLQSAAMTAKYFSFKAEETALLCLPLSYIAGKMMVVRALYSGLNLLCINPSTHPIPTIDNQQKIDFAPLIPMQLIGQSPPTNLRKVLLGGAPVAPNLELELADWPLEIYLGYGMTETLSHVAVRKISSNTESAFYHALPGIHFTVDDRNCLLIDVPFLKHRVTTNDVVELFDNTTFKWKGRYDNVVNSGSLKFFPEEIEKKLFPLIEDSFFIAGLPDAHFGQKLCLFIEKATEAEAEQNLLSQRMADYLNKYESPKEIFYVSEFIRTTSGKIKRAETMLKAGPKPK